MIYTAHYSSPLGIFLLAARKNTLIGLWIAAQKNYLSNFNETITKNDNYPILVQTKLWLDRYFSGKNPAINELALAPVGSEFARNVWKILCQIPYGTTTTYGRIAEQIAKQRGLKKMSAQAIGGAVGSNPISIIIPCHRVVGKNGSLTGYSGGIGNKAALLSLEGAVTDKLFIP